MPDSDDDFLIDEDYEGESSEGEYESEEDYDSENDGEAESTESVKDLVAMIAHNEAYLLLTNKIMKKVHNLLDANREQQRKIRMQLASGQSSAKDSKIFKKEFCPPYFHDCFGMVPVSNPESEAITNACSLNILMREPVLWSSEELDSLRDAVLEQLTEQITSSITAKGETLREKIKNYHAEDGMAQLFDWQTELNAVQKRLTYLKTKSSDELFKSANYDDIDWARISAVNFFGTRTIMQLKMKWLYEQAPNWKKGPWSEEEIDTLTEITKVPWVNWDVVSEKLKAERSPFQCFEKYVELQKKNQEKKPWTSDEDDKLVRLVETFKFGNDVNWGRVAAQIPNRNSRQCMLRYTQSLDQSLKRGRWSEAEDLLLTTAVNKYGPQDWYRIANQVPARSALQCRARWINNLDYKRSSNPWSVEEDEAILVGMKIFGRNQYAKIAKLLPGRNNCDTKNRSRTLLRWKIAAMVDGNSLRDVPNTSFSNSKSLRIKKFGLINKLSNDLNKKGAELNKRMGYGTFVVNDDGECDVDYSEVKSELCVNFGSRYIANNGRWCKMSKNPNEYGVEELQEEKEKLPREKRKILEEYLKQKSARVLRINDENAEQEDEIILKNVSELMVTNLEVTESDIEWYHRSKAHKKAHRAKVVKPPKEKKKRRRTSQKTKAKTDISMYISDLAPKRYSASDRMADEFCYNVAKLPKKDQRLFILTQMAESLAREMDANVKTALAKIPKELFSVKLVSYLLEFLKCNLCTLEPESGIHRQLNMSHLLSNLVPPTVCTLNSLFYYYEAVRKNLVFQTNELFLRSNKQESVFKEDNKDYDGILDIQLNDKITSSQDYLSLKARMFKLFFWPMMVKKSLETGQAAEIRNILRSLNVERRRNLEDIMKKAQIYSSSKENELVLNSNQHYIQQLNSLVKAKRFHYFDPQLTKKDLLIKPIVTRKDIVKPEQPVFVHIIDPLMQRKKEYRPRWAKGGLGKQTLQSVGVDQIGKLTLKDLMLLNARERLAVAAMAQENTLLPQKETAGSSQEQ
ncbi:unnamed protein product [Bursaphelenchus okinawaensis]|uniref:snRNA-activating protein complex subunit 4 n=1 Tax=Bursaphelenchus okinawaensis TaxID=465554 RepID=A0A811LM07_9BILA|nr:unnamed protein product [Bursaphelenchus okinawaensis]CAG9126310.1 unnamed protein product [Bursaphelenchus okinawaensis]